MKAIVAGCFSDENGNATAGDLLAAEMVCDWLDDLGCPYDVAVYQPFQGGVNLYSINPQDYTIAIYVCGPFGNRTGEADFTQNFSHCLTMGINLTMLEPVNEWNPFDILLERDSSERVRADMTFLSRPTLVPVVGVCLVESYGAPFEDLVYQTIKEFIASRPMAVIEIDTRLDTNRTGLRSSAEIESVLARMDLVITTRLHGTVLSLKNGVPTISIDVAGDNLKIQKQTGEIGWPVIFVGNEITLEKLNQAFDYCLTVEAKAKAKECANRAKSMVLQMRQDFINAITQSAKSGYVNASSISQDINFPIKHNKCDRIGVNLNVNLGWKKSFAEEFVEENNHWLGKIKVNSKQLLHRFFRR
jgi:hypothetical protein